MNAVTSLCPHLEQITIGSVFEDDDDDDLITPSEIKSLFASQDAIWPRVIKLINYIILFKILTPTLLLGKRIRFYQS